MLLYKLRFKYESTTEGCFLYTPFNLERFDGFPKHIVVAKMLQNKSEISLQNQEQR